jgi:hypothetical protein
MEKLDFVKEGGSGRSARQLLMKGKPRRRSNGKAGVLGSLGWMGRWLGMEDGDRKREWGKGEEPGKEWMGKWGGKGSENRGEVFGLIPAGFRKEGQIHGLVGIEEEGGRRGEGRGERSGQGVEMARQGLQEGQGVGVASEQGTGLVEVVGCLADLIGQKGSLVWKGFQIQVVQLVSFQEEILKEGLPLGVVAEQEGVGGGREQVVGPPARVRGQEAGRITLPEGRRIDPGPVRVRRRVHGPCLPGEGRGDEKEQVRERKVNWCTGHRGTPRGGQRCLRRALVKDLQIKIDVTPYWGWCCMQFTNLCHFPGVQKRPRGDWVLYICRAPPPYLHKAKTPIPLKR